MTSLSILVPIKKLAQSSLGFIVYLESIVKKISLTSSFKSELIVVYYEAEEGLSVDSMTLYGGTKFIMEPNKGIYTAWITGLEYTTSELICIVGLDDLVSYDFIIESLEKSNVLKQRKENINQVYTGRIIVSNKNGLKNKCEYVHNGRIVSRYINRSYICHSGCIMSKKLYDIFFPKTMASLLIFRDLHFLHLIQETLRKSSVHCHSRKLQVIFEGSGVSNKASYLTRLCEKIRISREIKKIPLLKGG